MMHQTLYNHAVKLVSDCSVPPHLSGFTFLSEAVMIKSKNYTIKLIDIYKRIAQNHHCTHRAVMRSIAYAISQAEHIGDYLSIGKTDIFNGKVIAMLALKLRSSYQMTAEI